MDEYYARACDQLSITERGWYILTQSPRWLGRGPLLAGLSLTKTRDDESLLNRHPCLEARHRFSGTEICG